MRSYFSMKHLITFFLSIALLIGFSEMTVAQQIEKSTKIEYIGGKNYYLHTVKAGQTLTAIATAYGTTIDDILACNPGMKKELKIDQVVKILVKAQAVPSNYTIHVVKQGETLSSIASSYKVRLDDVFRINPGLTSAIKPGQEIKIPKTSGSSETVAQSSFTVHVVQKSETLFSIARKYGVTVEELRSSNPGLNETIQIGQQIRVPVKGVEVKTPDKPIDTVRFECMKTGMLASYNISLMIPLYLEKATYIDTSDEDKSVKKYSSFAFIGFYEGFVIALDSLKKTGFSAKLYVEDIVEDTTRILTVLEKTEYDDMHLIIGPFFSNVYKPAADWAKTNKVKIVNPFTSKSDFVNDNPYVFKNVVSDTQQAIQAVDYMRKTWPGCNIILVNSGKESDKCLIDAYADALKGKDSSMTDYKIVSYGTDGFSGISKNLKADVVNVVISFIHGEASISNYIRNLSDYSFKFRIVAFGLPEWENYSSLESEYLLDINLHIVASAFVDYRKENVKAFIVEYRSRYHTEPDEYAFAGYDAAMYYGNALRLYGKDFEHCLGDYTPDLLEGTLKFVHKENSGYENSHICIYRYQDFKRLNALDEPETTIEVNKKNN